MDVQRFAGASEAPHPMTSPIHTAIVEALEAHPEALAYLLALQGAAPSGPLLPTTGTRTKILTLERRVDRAYLLGSRDRPTGFVLCEVQLDRDDDKRFSWPLYLELGRSRYRCEGSLAALTLSPRVRGWIRRRIIPASGLYGTTRRLKPTIIALDEIAPALLLRPDRPYLALFAVAARARTPDAKAVAESAVAITIDKLPKRLAAEQIDAILGMVDHALRAHLENRIMAHHEFKSPLFRGVFKEGEAKGKVEGKAESIVAFLAAREIPVSDTVRARILACTDPATLDLWIQRAAVASTAAAVVRARPPAKATARAQR